MDNMQPTIQLAIGIRLVRTINNSNVQLLGILLLVLGFDLSTRIALGSNIVALQNTATYII